MQGTIMRPASTRCVLIIYSILICIQTMDVLAYRPGKSLPRPIQRNNQQQSGPRCEMDDPHSSSSSDLFGRSTKGNLAGPHTLESLVELYLYDKIVLPDPGSFAGIAIALDKEHLLVDIRVRHNATKSAMRVLKYPNPHMIFKQPPASYIDAANSDVKEESFNYTLVKNFGILDIIKVKDPAHVMKGGFHSSIELATELSTKDCILYSWSKNPLEINTPKEHAAKFYVQHKVSTVPSSGCPQCLHDVCVFKIDALGAVCPNGPDFGTPIFCGGKLSHLVYHIDSIGSGECTSKFKAVNLHLYTKEINKAIGKK